MRDLRTDLASQLGSGVYVLMSYQHSRNKIADTVAADTRSASRFRLVLNVRFRRGPAISELLPSKAAGRGRPKTLRPPQTCRQPNYCGCGNDPRELCG